MSVTLRGTKQFGQKANIMFNAKNGAQQIKNVKNTNPRTLLAFCLEAIAFAARILPFVLPLNNLIDLNEQTRRGIILFSNRIFNIFNVIIKYYTLHFLGRSRRRRRMLSLKPIFQSIFQAIDRRLKFPR